MSDLGWLSSAGDWMVLASAFTWALYSISIRTMVRAHDPLAVTLAVLLPVTVLSTLYFGLSGHASLITTLPSSEAGMSSGQAGMFLFIEPLATTAVAVPLLNESFGFVTAAGAALMVAGVWWSQRRARHSASRTKGG